MLVRIKAAVTGRHHGNNLDVTVTMRLNMVTSVIVCRPTAAGTFTNTCCLASTQSHQVPLGLRTVYI